MRIAYSIIAAGIVTAFPGLYSQNADPKIALQQSLSRQYTLTKVSQDRTDILTAGTVLVLQKNGLMMYSTTSPMPPLNTYKNGKISQGMGGFGRDLAITMATGGNGTSADYPQHKFSAGDKFWLAAITVQRDNIVLQLFSDPIDDVRYYGQLKVPFDKRTVPSSDEALAKIAEVLTIQPADNAAESAPAPSDAAPAAVPAPPPPSEAAPAPLPVPPPPGDAAPAAHAPEVLVNADVVKMAKAGLDDSIIIAKIKLSTCQFDTSPDSLISLKQNGISSAVLRAMTQASRPQ